MVRLIAMASAALFPASCAPHPAPQPEMARDVSAAAFDEAACDAEAASVLIGREATPQMQAEALKLSGAAIVRLIPPFGALASDHITSRLNIETDARGRATGFRCG